MIKPPGRSEPAGEEESPRKGSGTRDAPRSIDLRGEGHSPASSRRWPRRATGASVDELAVLGWNRHPMSRARLIRILKPRGPPLSAIVPRLAFLVIGLFDPSGKPVDLPAVAEVSVEELEVFVEADERSYSTGVLRQGDRVTVRDTDRAGWLTIGAPANSFSWIEQRAIGPSDEASRARSPQGRSSAQAGWERCRDPLVDLRADP